MGGLVLNRAEVDVTSRTSVLSRMRFREIYSATSTFPFRFHFEFISLKLPFVSRSVLYYFNTSTFASSTYRFTDIDRYTTSKKI